MPGVFYSMARLSDKAAYAHRPGLNFIPLILPAS
jgi:hypothetical protein